MSSLLHGERRFVLFDCKWLALPPSARDERDGAHDGNIQGDRYGG